MRAYLYVVRAVKNPDDATSDPVPYLVNEDLIFFGACKKRIRDQLRNEFLLQGLQPSEPIMMLGFNSGSPKKVIWAGQITRIMTFAEAWELFSDPTRDSIRRDLLSPLHIKPIIRDGELKGYAKNGAFHEGKAEWLMDVFTKDPIRRGVQVIRHPRYPEKVAKVEVPEGETASSFFDRDCCFMLSTLHYARPGVKGLSIDQELLQILDEAQPNAREISQDAPFGVTRVNKPDGKAGRSLRLDGELATRLRQWLLTRPRT